MIAHLTALYFNDQKAVTGSTICQDNSCQGAVKGQSLEEKVKKVEQMVLTFQDIQDFMLESSFHILVIPNDRNAELRKCV